MGINVAYSQLNLTDMQHFNCINLHFAIAEGKGLGVILEHQIFCNNSYSRLL